MLPYNKQIPANAKPESKELTLGSFHSRDASHMLEKCLIEAKLSDSIFWAVELHVSKHGQKALDALTDFIIKFSGSTDLYQDFLLRSNRFKHKNVNDPGMRYLLIEMVGICYQGVSILNNNNWNVLTLPKVSAKDFNAMAPNQDLVKALLTEKNIDINTFPKQFITGLNEIIWTSNNYEDDMNLMDRLAWCSQMYCSYLYIIQHTRKTKIKPNLWIPWIWYCLSKNPNWKILSEWHKLKNSNTSWTAMCMCRGWFMTGIYNKMTSTQRLKLAIQSFKFYEKYI